MLFCARCCWCCLLKNDTCCFLCPLPRISFGYHYAPAIGLVLGVNSPSKSSPTMSILPNVTRFSNKKFKIINISLVISKKCCTFAPESSTPGYRGWEVSPLGKPTRLPKFPSHGFQDILKRRLLTLCSDDSKSRKFQLCSGLSNGRCPTGYRLSYCAY